MLLSDTLIQIIAYGGGVSIDASKYSPDTLITAATTASQSGATIIIRNVRFLLPDTMYKIAIAGRGKVIFEIE